MIVNIQCIKHFAIQSDNELYTICIDTETHRKTIQFNVKNLDNKTVAKGLRELANNIENN